MEIIERAVASVVFLFGAKKPFCAYSWLKIGEGIVLFLEAFLVLESRVCL